MYVGVVGSLGAIFQAIPGPTLPLLATALIALVVRPARDRIQRWASRLVYGQRDEPYPALAGLGRRLETTFAPETVLSAIVTTVSDALRLPYVALTPAAPGSPGLVVDVGPACGYSTIRVPCMPWPVLGS